LSGAQGRAGRAGWLFADLGVALMLVFLASAGSKNTIAPPVKPVPAGSQSTTSTTQVGLKPCVAVVSRYGEMPANATAPLLGFSERSDPAAAGAALHAWLDSLNIAEVRPAFVQVFGVAPSGGIQAELALAKRFADVILPRIIPAGVPIDLYYGAAKATEGINLLWYIARC
jgi:hypothetical protein